MTHLKLFALGLLAVFMAFAAIHTPNLLSAPDNQGAGEIRVTILYDNYVHNPDSKSDWGFACLIEGTEKTILFDTGTKSDILWHNIRTLGVDAGKIEQIVISHIHGDHTGGLLSVLEKKKDIPVYIPDSSPDSFIMGIQNTGNQPVKILEPIDICKDVFLTGEMGTSIKEISLAIKRENGAVLITGCAHPGIVDIVKKAGAVTGKNVKFAFGGFHLMNHSDVQIQQNIQSFKAMGVEKCGATHCTGEKAIQQFKEAYGKNFVPMGVGRVIVLSDEM
ncbi:MAG: MBL fold metallo-hydrolase [Candidatus Aminicenantales bacterium]